MMVEKITANSARMATREGMEGTSSGSPSGHAYVQSQVAAKGWPSGNMTGGGRRKKRRMSKSKKGGSSCYKPHKKKSARRRKKGGMSGVGGVVREALVPFGLYALTKRQQRRGFKIFYQKVDRGIKKKRKRKTLNNNV